MMGLSAECASRPGWLTTEAVELDASSWSALIRNELPLLIIRGFASHEECAKLGARAELLGFAPYSFVEPPIDRIGMTVFEYDKLEAAQYFAEVECMRNTQREIFAGAFDPLVRFRQRLAAATGVDVGVARDPERGSYYAGLVRRIENGTLLHIDYAPAEQPKWTVASIRDQFAWNLYVELDSSRPGKTHIYNRPWQRSDDDFKIPGSYGYQHQIVSGVERASFLPTLGDVYIFNTRNFHEVDACNSRRTTVTSAGGVFPNGEIAIWS